MLPTRRAPVGLDGHVLVVLAEPGSALLALQLIREEAEVVTADSALRQIPPPPLSPSFLAKKKLPHSNRNNSSSQPNQR